MQRLGGDPSKINPLCPVDLVIDHSVQADVHGTADAAKQNEIIEFNRNRERFQFLKWGSTAFDNFKIVPPGSGIVHQVNLEYLARVVFNRDGLLYNDSVVKLLNLNFLGFISLEFEPLGLCFQIYSTSRFSLISFPKRTPILSQIYIFKLSSQIKKYF